MCVMGVVAWWRSIPSLVSPSRAVPRNQFCQPDGVVFRRAKDPPTLHPFVLTEMDGRHLFGTALNFFEDFAEVAGERCARARVMGFVRDCVTV